MTIYSNVGDESGVWGIVVSVEKVMSNKSLVDNGPPDMAPFLVNLLGLKDEKQFRVHSDKQRTQMFAAGFELDPQGNNLKLIGPDGAGWMNMTAEQQSLAANTLNALRKRFVIRPCQSVGKGGTVEVNEKCHTAELLLEKGENIKIEAPYEFPLDPKDSTFDQMLYVELGQGGRDTVQTHGAINQGPAK
jgi:hypothetical protein